MILVADTGPLIGLAKIQRIQLLEALAGTVLIPPAVRRELLSHLEHKF
jgi:predicted nucleic acid-binding protein